MSIQAETDTMVEERLDRLKLLLGEEDVFEEVLSLPDQGRENQEEGVVEVASHFKASPLRAPTAAGHASSIASDTKEVIWQHDVQTGGITSKPAVLPEVAHGPAPTVDFPDIKLEFAEQELEEKNFVQLKALLQFPYKNIPKEIRDTVVSAFFEQGLIYERTWDFFYIYPPVELSHKSIILVPAFQVERFFEEINRRLKTRLKIPVDAIAQGLVIEFPKDDTPHPRYIGRSTTRTMAEHLKQDVPSASWAVDNEPEQTPSDTSLAAFKARIALLIDVDRRKKVAVKEKKKVERHHKQQAWNHVIKRVQRYLGIRGAGNGHQYSMSRAVNVPKLPFNSSHPVLFSPESSVVFISIDVEAYERAHHIITEIGISTLDTADIGSMPCGDGAKDWRSLIRARHFLIKEYQHLKNSEFLDGCPDKFSFGRSEIISIKDAPSAVAKCFKHPFSQPGVDADPSLPKRNVVIVGHDVKTDIAFLQKLGYNPYNMSNLHELVDTSNMYRALKRDSQPTNLGAMLADLEIAAWYLHNAGNDAAYTLQAMLGIAVRAVFEKQDRLEQMKKRISETVKDAVENAWEQQLGWSSGGEGSDGGLPETIPDRRHSQSSTSGTNSHFAQQRQGTSTGCAREGKPWRSSITASPPPAPNARQHDPTSACGVGSGFIPPNFNTKAKTSAGQVVEAKGVDEAEDLITW